MDWHYGWQAVVMIGIAYLGGLLIGIVIGWKAAAPPERKD